MGAALAVWLTAGAARWAAPVLPFSDYVTCNGRRRQTSSIADSGSVSCKKKASVSGSRGAIASLY